MLRCTEQPAEQIHHSAELALRLWLRLGLRLGLLSAEQSTEQIHHATELALRLWLGLGLRLGLLLSTEQSAEQIHHPAELALLLRLGLRLGLLRPCHAENHVKHAGSGLLCCRGAFGRDCPKQGFEQGHSVGADQLRLALELFRRL